MSHRIVTIVSMAVAIGSLSLWAVEKHGGHTAGMIHRSSTADKPREGGQATFAALIEIVAALEADDHTDWHKVDIDGLRKHLVDMNHLMLNTDATTTINSENNIHFEIIGTDTSIPSIHRMVPAHSRFLEQSRGWRIEPEITNTGASVTVTVADSQAVERLNSLGFYGFMSLDSHHQAHHYQMALGHPH